MTTTRELVLMEKAERTLAEATPSGTALRS
jgi:hypothetical protein